MYNILPFQFLRFNSYETLIVNECGDFYFIDNSQFDSFVQHKLDENSKEFIDLKSKLFVTQGNNTSKMEKLSAKYRTRKAFLRDFTSLHMLVMTLRCNQRCAYCQVSCADEDSYKYDMNPKIAQKVVDIIFESPSTHIKIEFQGGEPLLNWEVVKFVVQYARKKNEQTSKKLDFILCTNLISISKEQLFFCRDNNMRISTSLDGPQQIHDSCRILRIGTSSHRAFLEKFELARQILGNNGIDALMTTTAFSVHSLEEVIDEYVKHGMNGIFIRSLNPYGFAQEQVLKLGYDTDCFIQEYIKALHYILKINKKVYFPEYFATLLLSRILTPFSTGFVDLQSPSGAGISGAIYDFDGSVYPADEARMLARMGDTHFCLGNVQENSFQEIFASQTLFDITLNSCVETTFPCAWCAFQTYCGTDPVRNYLETGDKIRNMTGSPFCLKHKAIFTHLFELIRTNNDEYDSIFWSWITRNPDLVKRYENN